MSLLKHAKQYLANQSKYAHLNAFVSLAEPTTLVSQPNVKIERHNVQDRVIAVKDNICTADLRTTASSGLLKEYTSPYNATVVELLLDEGAMVCGKTNMDEFGMGSHSTHSHAGAVRMQRHAAEEDMSAGGSSGGSALAVATAQCWAALGTDTGGSVRLPAAYSGVVGFKPSYGLLSRWGVIAYANSLDTVGILGKNVSDVRAVFDKLNKYDTQDPTSLPPSTRTRLNGKKKTSLRIGVPLDYNISTLQPAVRQTWIRTLKELHEQGHSLHPVRLPATQHALSAYYILAPAEASSNLAKYDGVRYGSRAEGIDGTPESVLFAKTRGQGFGPEVQRRILLGAFTLSAQAMDNYFIQAQKIRRLVQQDFNRVFTTPNPLLDDVPATNTDETTVDVIVCPTAPTLAPSLASVKDQDPISAYMNDVFTVPASLAGLPSISVPVRITCDDDAAEQPFEETAGIQIIGQYGDDDCVLAAADIVSKIAPTSQAQRDTPDVTSWGARISQ
ncbi:Trimeric GatFAB AmidoTransferase(AdT) complex subunit [Didymella pomorum]|uniref:Glutamyl-tRNA(Gln) amidotransferase subunit A, mitochondrial n=1 Tax=Didymella pomorum TaxID=749634 RepID=A0A9W9D7B2_9PLEO|nr:Trimeric GatFAB AmidoTransferase(AdT) complex subunit [Didymella pomorum]